MLESERIWTDAHLIDAARLRRLDAIELHAVGRDFAGIQDFSTNILAVLLPEIFDHIERSGGQGDTLVFIGQIRQIYTCGRVICAALVEEANCICCWIAKKKWSKSKGITNDYQEENNGKYIQQTSHR